MPQIKRMWKRDFLPLIRVSFETSFNLKQPKLEPKLVSALSETKRLFRLFRFYIETEIFDVSIEPKQTKDQPKQFDREHILVFIWKFRVVSKQIWFVSIVSIYVRNTETNRNKPKFLFFVSRNKPKHNRNRSCFGMFRFQPTFFFFVSRTPYLLSILLDPWCHSHPPLPFYSTFNTCWTLAKLV